MEFALLITIHTVSISDNFLYVFLGNIKNIDLTL